MCTAHHLTADGKSSCASTDDENSGKFHRISYASCRILRVIVVKGRTSSILAVSLPLGFESGRKLKLKCSNGLTGKQQALAMTLLIC